ncbi:hypothetical protein F4801DRAFT_248044 [Xylaria longipes]|nr:hypothetical protein F4801DRAFT_248044 [Xylaria longipes]
MMLGRARHLCRLLCSALLCSALPVVLAGPNPVSSSTVPYYLLMYYHSIGCYYSCHRSKYIIPVASPPYRHPHAIHVTERKSAFKTLNQQSPGPKFFLQYAGTRHRPHRR